jgi:hypothetical protein
VPSGRLRATLFLLRRETLLYIDYQNVNNVIDSILEVLEFMVCKRCHRQKGVVGGHHSGLWREVIPRFDSYDKAQQWSRRYLFDGFSRLVTLTLIKPQIINAETFTNIQRNELTSIERIIVSALFNCSIGYKPLQAIQNGEGEQTDAVKTFRKIVEPALRTLWIGRNEEWVRFGVEKQGPYPFGQGVYPLPEFHSQNPKINKAAYSVEIGTLRGHALETTHGAMWAKCAGLITMRQYQQCGGELIHCPGKDHLFGHGQLPLQSWVFCHKVPTDFSTGAIKTNQAVCLDSHAIRTIKVLEMIEAYAKAMGR